MPFLFQPFLILKIWLCKWCLYLLMTADSDHWNFLFKCQPLSTMNLPAYHNTETMFLATATCFNKNKLLQKNQNKALNVVLILFLEHIEGTNTHSAQLVIHPQTVIYRHQSLDGLFDINLFDFFKFANFVFSILFSLIRILRDSEQTYVVATFC